MKKADKILMFCSPFILLATNLLYGFCIGGKTNIIYYLIISIVSILLFGKLISSSKVTRSIMKTFLLVVLSVSINFVFYNIMNSLTADKSSETEYYQIVNADNIFYTKGQIAPVVLFYNSCNEFTRSELRNYKDYDDSIEKQHLIKVTEKMGGFNFPCYYVLLVD